MVDNGTTSGSETADEPGTETASAATQDMRPYEQHGFEVRFGWGPNGLRRLAPHVDAVVIIDVMSFSTSVDIAVSRGVTVFPYRWHNGTEFEFAKEVDAVVATKGGESGWSLRPSSLIEAPAGLRLVLPSPNGSALTHGAKAAGASQVIVGCLRNAPAVARALDSASSVAVIAGGERWRGTTGPLRPAIEDHLGAGAIVSALGRRSVSPEAMIAAAAFEAVQDNLTYVLRESASGREFRARGRDADFPLVAAYDVSETVPILDGKQLVPLISV